MKQRLAALLAALALLCAACGGGEKSGGEGENTYLIYWPAAAGREDGSALTAEERTLAEPATARELMACLLSGPQTEELTSPFPRGTTLRSCRVADGVAKVDLSEAYDGLSGVDLSLADGCIVLTLCQLPEVERVYLTVGGRPRPYRDQILSPDDLLLSNGRESWGRAEVTLFFPRGSGLGQEARTLTLAMGDELPRAALQALLAGPETGLLEPVCPEGTRLLGLRRSEGGYELDLSASFLEGEEDPRRLLAVADTLAWLEGEETAVSFLVEGEALEEYGGLDLTKPLTGRLHTEEEHS